MKTLNRKLVRDLYRSKWLLLAITSIIAVGVMSFVSMLSIYRNLDHAKHSYYARCRMADFWVDVKKVPLGELQSLMQIDGVGQLQPRIAFAATVDLPDTIKPINAFVVSLPDRQTHHINSIVLRRGDYFTGDRENQVIINDAFARANSLAPGDRLHVLLNNRRQELQIVGTGISSEFTYTLGPGEIVPDPNSFGVLFIKQSYAEEVFDFEGAANQIVGRFAGDLQAGQREILDQIENALDEYGVASVTPLDQQASNQFLSNEIEGLGAFASVLPAIFLIVAALVLNVLINRLTRQQRTIIGTFKALGYSNHAVFLHFLTFGLLVGVLGGTIGGFLGYLSASGMTIIYRQYFEFPELPSRFDVSVLLAGLVISLLCAIGGSLHGARAMLRLSAADAMRPEPPRSAGAIWLERWFPGFWQTLGSGWRMAIRSVARARFRTLAGLFAATMGSALLVCGFMMTKAQNYLLEFQFEQLLRSDVELTLESERGRDAMLEIARLPGVTRAEPLFNLGCTFVNGPYRRKGGVTGLADDARLTIPSDTSGRRLALPDRGIIITRRLAQILHVRPGDRLTIVPVKGDRRPVEVSVAKIADSYMGLAAYAEIGYLSRLVGEAYVVTGAQLAMEPHRSALHDFYREMKHTPGVKTVTARRDMVKNLREAILESQWIFVMVLVVFAGVIFFGSIVNASMVNLAERQREVATLLAVGYSRWQVGTAFLRESLLTNLSGTVIGMPVGYGLTVLTAVAYENDLIRLPVVTAPWIWISTFALAVVFALSAHAAVQWQIHRMPFVEALKVKE